MKKRTRMFLPVLVILAMLVSLFGMATPVMASEITATKDVTDPFAVNIYYVGDTIYYEMTVENPGADETNTLTRIWDTLPDGTVIEFLAPAETLVQAPGDVDYFYAEYVVVEADLEWIDPADPSIDPYWGVVNTFEAIGYDTAGDDVYAYVEKNSQVLRPCIDVEKTVDCNNDGEFLDEDYGVAGDTGHWKVVVTNCGEDPLLDVWVWDDLYGMLEVIPEFAPGDSRTYEYDTVVNEDTTNWAYVDGYDELGGYWSDEDWATNYVLQPCIDIQKTVDCNDDGVFLDEDYGIVGDTGHWRIVVTNCGDVPLYDVWVSDDLYGMLEIIPEFAPGDSRTYEYDTVVNVDTTNWAYADGFDEFGGYWYAEDWATNYVLQPCIDIQKTVDCNDDGIFLDEDYGTAGDTGHWRIVVTNCGEADLFDVYVWDTNGMFWGPFTLVAGDSVQYDYDTIVNETTTNVAYVEAYDELGGVWYDEDDATNVVTGNEGCTPGFWKNNARNWEASAWFCYAPGDSFECAFGVSNIMLRGKGKSTIDDPTLLEALGANGGGINALARHAVAALLNICNPNVNYAGGMSVCALQLAVQEAVAAGEDAIQALHTELAGYNEAGCSVNQHGEPIIPDGMVV